MDEIKHKKDKLYYSMGEVSEMFDVNPSLIRFWEQKFDILKPRKNNKGNRMFSPEDVDNLKLIYHLVKEKGMTLSGAQKRIKGNKEGTRRDMEVIDRLLSIRSTLMEIRQELNVGSDAAVEDLMDEPVAITRRPEVAPALLSSEPLLEPDDIAPDGLPKENSVMEVLADMPPEEPETETTMEEIMEMEAEAEKQIQEDIEQQQEEILEREEDWVDDELERVDDVCDMIDDCGTDPYPRVTMDQIMGMEAEATIEIEQDRAKAEKELAEAVFSDDESQSGFDSKLRPELISRRELVSGAGGLESESETRLGSEKDPESHNEEVENLLSDTEQILFEVEAVANQQFNIENEYVNEPTKEDSVELHKPRIVEQTLF